MIEKFPIESAPKKAYNEGGKRFVRRHDCHYFYKDVDKIDIERNAGIKMLYSIDSWTIDLLRGLIKNTAEHSVGDICAQNLFSGVMDLDAFADYVVYELCTELYLQDAKTHSLRHHVDNTIEAHKKYLEYEGRISGKVKDIDAFSFDSLYTGIRGYLSRMIDHRTSDLSQHHPEWLSAHCTPADEEASPPQEAEFKAVISAINAQQRKNPILLDLLQYDSNDPNQRSQGYSIPYAFYLQAYTSYSLGIRNQKYIRRLANKNCTYLDAQAHYLVQDAFFVYLSPGEYCDDFTDADCDRYIAHAINLKTFEQTYFQNTLYTYAVNLSIKVKTSAFLTGIIPPIFLEYLDVGEIFPHCVCAGLLPPDLFTNRPFVQKFNARKPYLFLEKYAMIFASSNEELRRIEECRYYAIQILAAVLLQQLRELMHSRRTDLHELSRFIHERYNIAAEMLKQKNIHESAHFETTTVTAMRQIIRSIQRYYGFIDRE